jgi:zinc protease
MRGVLVVAALAVRLAVSPAFGQERFRRTPPLPDARPVELKLPEVRTIVLGNGLTVATAVQPGSLSVTLQLVVKAGEADSPPDRPGLAGMTARMIGKGTKLLSAEHLENMVEAMGAEYAVTTLMDYTALSLRVLPDQLDRAIFVLRHMALDAEFSERELAALRREVYWELFERKKDPEVLAWRHLLRVLFEDHPYRTATYAEDVIKFISAKDVAAFYERFYRPANAALLVFGAIDGETTALKVASHFGAWAGAAPGRAPLPPPAPNVRDRVCFVEAPDVSSAAVFAGNVIMDASDPDFFPFLVLKQVLGGTTRSRLFMNLRESKGYAFYAFSETEFFRSCGVYWARALVRPETIVAATREILREIEALARTPAEPTEIEEGKSYVVGNLPTRFESPDGFAEGMARYVALGLDEAQWDKGPERIKLVNADMVRDVARKHLTARPAVVIVGRPEWLGPVAEAFASVEVYGTTGTLVRTLHKGERP